MTPLKLHGVVGTPVTPFDAGGGLDTETFETLIGFLLDTSVDAVALPMHIGESLNLTATERKRVAELAAGVIAGQVPLLVNVSCAGTDEAIDLARHAEHVGAAGLVLLTPYYWRPPAAALVEHFAAVADSVGIGLVAYSSPTHMGVEISLDVVAELIDRLDNFVALKDASFNMEYFTELCRVTRELRPEFATFTGVEHLLPSTVVGGSGCFSAAGAVAPVLVRRLYDACSARNLDEARELQYEFSRLYQVIQAGYPAAIKAAMGLMGRPVGGTRRPLPSLTAEETARLAARLDEMPFLEREPRGWEFARGLAR
jgi:4-hydroxy-tetrahydrodipicolinate synthase